MSGNFARMRELFPKVMTARATFPREPMKLLKCNMPCPSCNSTFCLKLDDLVQCLNCMFRGKQGQIYRSFKLNGWFFYKTDTGVEVICDKDRSPD
jgi:hypothetical protein